MNIAHLEYYAATVKYGGFSAAARKLYISPQALCRAVSNLESSLGVDLFVRVGRHVDPTPFGVQFYKKAIEVLESIADLEVYAESANIKARFENSVSLAVAETSTRGNIFYLADFDGLVLSDSGASYSIMFNSSGMCQSALEDSIVDSAVVFGRVGGEDILCRKLFSFEPRIAMHEKHPLAKYDCLRVTDIVSFPIAAPIDLKYSYSAITELFAERGMRVNYSHVSAQRNDIHAFYRANGLAFVIADSSFLADNPGIVLRPLSANDALSIPVCFACRRDDQGSAMISKLKAYLVGLSKQKAKNMLGLLPS